MTVQRIVVRNGLSRDMARSLLDDIEESVRYFDKLTEPLPDVTRSSYHH